MKHIKIEINKLFEEMKIEIQNKWLWKTFSHYWKWRKERYFSKTIWEFRLKALNISKNNKEWDLEEKNYFCTRFWRKTTPYFWCKKEL